MELLLIIALLATAAFVASKLFWPKSLHTSAQMLRFAESSGADVLSCNWDHDEYYARMYKYASPELASHMYKNKLRLNSVLSERAELLGDYVALKELELKRPGFSLLPSPVYEFAGTLYCSKACLPVIILVNAARQDLSLDGIRVLKKEAETKNQDAKKEKQ